MAYRRTAKSGSSRRRASPARSSYRARASYGRRSANGRAGGSRRGATGARTIRIVIENPAANAVARPPLGMVPAAEPKKAIF